MPAATMRVNIVNKLRISLTEKHADIKGSIQVDGDGVFRLECLALIVEHFAKAAKVSPEEICNDAIWTLKHDV